MKEIQIDMNHHPWIRTLTMRANLLQLHPQHIGSDQILVWVGIDLSKEDIGLFEKDSRKKWQTLLPRIRRRVRNYDKKEKRKRDYCKPRRSLSDQLLEEPLYIGALVSQRVGSTTPPRKRNHRDEWKVTDEVAVHHTIRDTHHSGRVTLFCFNSMFLKPPFVRIERSFVIPYGGDYFVNLIMFGDACIPINQQEKARDQSRNDS
jgi:hypothetical protein